MSGFGDPSEERVEHDDPVCESVHAKLKTISATLGAGANFLSTLFLFEGSLRAPSCTELFGVALDFDGPSFGLFHAGNGGVTVCACLSGEVEHFLFDFFARGEWPFFETTGVNDFLDFLGSEPLVEAPELLFGLDELVHAVGLLPEKRNNTRKALFHRLHVLFWSVSLRRFVCGIRAAYDFVKHGSQKGVCVRFKKCVAKENLFHRRFFTFYGCRMNA